MKALSDPQVRQILSWLLVVVAAMVVLVITFVLPEDFMRAEQPVQAAEQPVVTARDAADEQVAVAQAGEVAKREFGEGAIPIEKVAPASPNPEEFIDQLPAVGEAQDVAAPAPVKLPSGQVEWVEEEERDWHLHVVVPVETLESIAHRYGVRPESLRMWNGLPQTANDLQNGSQLRVKPRRIPPPRFHYEYTVQPGDSWWSIGTRFGVDSYDLRAFNWGAGQRLKVGQVLQMWLDPVVFEWIAVEERPDDPTALRVGAVGSGPPQNGRLINGLEIPDSAYWAKKLPPSSYGTTFAVGALMEAIARFESKARDYEPPLVFGSMSYKHGGPIEGHLSHQTGRDLDIRLPLRAKYPQWYDVTPKRVDWEALWHLVSAFHETGQVMVIFFDYELQAHLRRAGKKLGASDTEITAMLQYPNGPRTGGFLRHSHGHEAHIHVRFGCGPHEPECVPSGGADELDGG